MNLLVTPEEGASKGALWYQSHCYEMVSEKVSEQPLDGAHVTNFVHKHRLESLMDEGSVASE